MNFRYILRYYIDATFSAHERIEELATFCQSSAVEEVMLFMCPEEMSLGHPTEGELQEFIDLAIKVKSRLASIGVALSLNPWTTLNCVPRGRTLRPGQNFRLMTGESGVESPLIACPLCPEWQTYLAHQFSRLAAEIDPVAIWIEDDWRLHNHGGELGWGGCFCDAHLARFSKEIGCQVTLDQLLNNLLAPGQPHSWRAQWHAFSRESLLEPLRRLAAAVDAANPRTRLALMSSRVDQHSAEGRDWAQFQSVIGKPDFLVRPHMEPYTQGYSLRTTPSVTRQTLACLSRPFTAYPELENSPRCGIYSKSANYTRWQMLEAALLGSRGITINHFDMLGNGIALDPKFGTALSSAKPILNALAALNLDDEHAMGVQILFSPKVATHLQLANTSDTSAPVDGRTLAMQFQDPASAGAASADGVRSIQALVHPSNIWADVCCILGLSHRFSTEINPDAGPIAVNGETLRCYSDDEIVKLLSGDVLLDALAVNVLVQRNFGPAIGVGTVHWRKLSRSVYSYEAIVEPDASEYGVAHPRMTAQRCAERLLEMQPLEGARELTTIYTPGKKRLWAGALSYENQYGGNIISLSYPFDGRSQFFVGFFNVFRKRWLERILFRAERTTGLIASEDGTRVYRLKTSGGTLIAVLNPTNDPFDKVALRHSAREKLTGSWSRLSRDGTWHPIFPDRGEHRGVSTLEFQTPLNPLDGVILLHQAPPAHS